MSSSWLLPPLGPQPSRGGGEVGGWDRAGYGLAGLPDKLIAQSRSPSDLRARSEAGSEFASLSTIGL